MWLKDSNNDQFFHFKLQWSFPQFLWPLLLILQNPCYLATNSSVTIWWGVASFCADLVEGGCVGNLGVFFSLWWLRNCHSKMKTKWGTIEVENTTHCEFAYLRDLLIRTHMQNIKDITSTIHFEAYRLKCLHEGSSAGQWRRGEGTRSPGDVDTTRPGTLPRVFTVSRHPPHFYFI